MSLEQVAAQRSPRADRPLSVTSFLSQLRTRFVAASDELDPLVFINVPRSQARSILQHGIADTLVSVSLSGALGMHSWLPYNKQIEHYFTFEKDASLSSTRTRRYVPGPRSQDVEMTSRLFAVTPDAKLMFSAGHWDNSIRVYSLTKHKTVQTIRAHTGTLYYPAFCCNVESRHYMWMHCRCRDVFEFGLVWLAPHQWFCRHDVHGVAGPRPIRSWIQPIPLSQTHPDPVRTRLLRHVRCDRHRAGSRCVWI